MPVRAAFVLLVAMISFEGIRCLAQDADAPRPDLLQTWDSMSADDRQRHGGGFALRWTREQALEIGLDEAQWVELELLKKQYFEDWREMRARQTAKSRENELTKPIDEQGYRERSRQLAEQQEAEAKLAVQQYATRVQSVLLPSQRLAYDHLVLRNFVLNNSTPQSVFSIPQALATSLELTDEEQNRLDDAIARAKAAIQDKLLQARKEAAQDIENALAPGQVLTLHELAGETWIEPVFKK